MKLFELITTTTKTKSMKTPFDYNRLRNDAAADGLDPSSGMYAIGKKHPTDPHMFSKKLFYPSNLEIDSYYQYIKAIEPHMGSNPYFPRVYGINMVKDAEGVQKPTYKMEKLSTFNDFDKDAIFALGQRILRGLPSTATDVSAKVVYQQIISVIDRALDSRAYAEKQIRDKKLLQALELIRKVIAMHPKFRNDIHSDNIMLRGTSQGPQLVITDPIADGFTSPIKKGQSHGFF